MKIYICLQFWNLFLLGASRLHHSNHVKYLLQPVKERERSPTQGSIINKKPTNQRPLLIPLNGETYHQNTPGGQFNDFKQKGGSRISGISQTSSSNGFPNLSSGFGSSGASGLSTFPKLPGSNFQRRPRPLPGGSNSFYSPGFQVPAGYNDNPSSAGFSGSFDSSGSKSNQPPTSQFGNSRGSFGVFRPSISSSGVLAQSGFSGSQIPSGSSGSLNSSGFKKSSRIFNSSGSQGPSGSHNPSVLSGSAGSLGPSRFQNSPGSSGSSGFLGSSGFKNPSGISGSSGSRGPSGFQNPSVLSGSSGSFGSSGFQNSPGLSGSSGSLGSSGFKPPSGISDSSGSLGPSGFQNPSVLSGSSAAVGSSGFHNPSELSGPHGSLGSSKFQNHSGISGSYGSQGSSFHAKPSGPSSFTGHLDPSQTQGSSGFSHSSGSSGVLNQSGFSTFSRPSTSSRFNNSYPKSPGLSSGFTSDPSGSHGSSIFYPFPGSLGSRKPIPGSFGVTGYSKFSETHGFSRPFEIPEYTYETDLSFSKSSGPSFNTHFFPTESTTTTTTTTTTSPSPSPRVKRPGLLSPVSKPSKPDSGNSNNIHNPPSNVSSGSLEPNQTPNRGPFGIPSSGSNKRPLGSFFTPPSSYDIPGKSKESTIPFSSLLSPVSASSSAGNQQSVASVSNANNEDSSKGDSFREIPNEDSSTDSLEPKWHFSLLCFFLMFHHGL